MTLDAGAAKKPRRHMVPQAGQGGEHIPAQEILAQPDNERIRHEFARKRVEAEMSAKLGERTP